MAGHSHVEGGPTCRFRTKKECDAHFADWEDDNFIALAAAAWPKYKQYHSDRSPDAILYTQVVQVLAGVRADLLNKEGNPNQSPAAKRLRRAIDRYRERHPVVVED